MPVTIHDKILPVVIALVLLILFNIGLYMRLAASPITTTSAAIELPYTEDFVEPVQYLPFSGDWVVQDGRYVQTSATGFDLGTIIPVDIAADTPYRYEVDLETLSGSPGGGLLFSVQGQTRQRSHMLRFNVDGEVLYLIWGLFGEDSDFEGQGSLALEIPPDDNTPQRIGVLVDETAFRITLNGDTRTDALPLTYRGGAVGLITSASQVAFDNILIEQWDAGTSTDTDAANTPPDTTAEPVTSTPTLLFADSFDSTGTGDSLWQPITGDWQFTEGSFRQIRTDGFDFSAGYNAPIAADDYRLDVTLRHQTGQGGGLLFNMQQPNRLAGSQMVRYVSDADFLMWGWFDANGVFSAQGSVPVSSPEGASHTLSVVVSDTDYQILLDGERLTETVAVETNGDYIGLVTAQSAVSFDEVRVSAPEMTALDAPESAAEPSQFNAVTGDWVFGETIVQRSTETVDYVAGTGIAAETFRMSVTVTLPDALDDAGAGIVFHMQGRDDIAGGQMVRFGSGGTEIFWGSYDDTATFAGLGGAPLNLDWSESHVLSLVVRETNYDILVDERTIVTGVPLESDFGWLGLLSYRGEVQFSDFELTIGR